MKILSQDGMMLTESENITIYIDRIMGSTDKTIVVNGNVYGKYSSENICKAIIEFMYTTDKYRMPQYR